MLCAELLPLACPQSRVTPVYRVKNLKRRKLEEKKGAREESCRAFPRGANQAGGGWVLPSAHLPRG